MYILRASWKISYCICIYVYAKCCHPQKIKSLLTYLLILSRNEVLTSIKGCYSVTNLRNLTFYNPNLDIINVNVHTKFG